MRGAMRHPLTAPGGSMSASRVNARRLFALSTILLGMLLAGSACTNDPNGETGGCSYNGTSHACE